jgi:hypothetical protein
MDFMFEDEADEVGSDVEAYCPKCKADTTHVVISKYEEEIRRVQCNPCGDVHSYRKPRGETEDDVPEPVSARKRAALKKLNWDEFFARKSQNDAKPYEFRERYRENLIVRHPKFGVGFVSEVVSDSKVEITFQDARRILVHNRRDIPGLPLAAEGDGVPTPPKSAKPVKEAPTKAAGKDKVEVLPPDGVKATKGPKLGGKAEKPPAPEKEAKAPALKLVTPVAPPAAPATKSPAAKAPAAAAAKAPAPEPKAHKVESKSKPAAKPPASKPAKPAAKASAKPAAKPAGKPAAKAAKSAAPRGGKTAAKPAAKKPAPQPKKKAGKKR